MTSLANDIKNLSGYGRVFPNVGTLGRYSAGSQAVTVQLTDLSGYEAMRRDANPLGSWRFFSVCLHELTHWLDHVSTLWGQRNIVDYHNAFNAWSNQDPGEFWRLMHLQTEVRRGALEGYYTVVDLPDTPPPWQQGLTCGMEYDAQGRLSPERPIAFMTFSTEDGRRICRTPLTVAALLEGSAMWAEYHTTADFLWSVDSDDAVVERGLQQKEMLDRLYDPNLALYSAAVQLVAKVAGSVNAYEAYELCAALSLLCLNLPDEAFGCLVVPEDISGLLGEREAGFRSRRDRGFALMALAESAPRYGAGYGVEEWLREAAARSGLPPLEDIGEQVRLELEGLPDTLIEGPNKERALALLEIGRRNHEARGVIAGRPLSLDDLTPEGRYLLPPVVLDDDTVISLGYWPVTHPLLQPGGSVALESRYLNASREFREACTS